MMWIVLRVGSTEWPWFDVDVVLGVGSTEWPWFDVDVKYKHTKHMHILRHPKQMCPNNHAQTST